MNGAPGTKAEKLAELDREAQRLETAIRRFQRAAEPEIVAVLQSAYRRVQDLMIGLEARP